MSAPRRYRAEIRITPREGILDPEGATIERALRDLGYGDVADVRAGRLVRLTVAAADEAEARSRVEEMCERLIANPIVEDYAVRVEAAEGAPAS